MANNNAQNVSFGKPKLSGVVYRAPMGTPLPANASDPLDKAFENVGYISDAGITGATDSETNSITEMGGKNVLTVVSSTSESYQFVMLETNPVAAKVRYGEENVEVDALGGMTIKHNGLPSEMSEYVIDLVLTGNRADRTVIPSATVSEVGEITMNSTDAKGWDVTLAANADDRIDGATSKEYIAALIDNATLVTAEEDEAPASTMTVGETQTLAVNALPSGASEPVKVTEGFTVESSDPETVSVAGNVITAKKEGEALIFAYVGNRTLSAEITVGPAAKAMAASAKTRSTAAKSK